MGGPATSPGAAVTAEAVGGELHHHVHRALADLAIGPEGQPAASALSQASARVSRWNPVGSASQEDDEPPQVLGAAWPLVERARRFAALAADDPERTALLLRGDELTEARRLAEGRRLPTAALALLLTSERGALQHERARLEEEQVRQGLKAAEAAALRQRRLQRIFVLLGVVGLLMAAGLLAEGALLRRAHQAEQQARGAETQARAAQAAALAQAAAEKQAHAATQRRLSEAQGALAAQEERARRLRRTLGEQEVRAGQVQGDLVTLFKKRIAARSARSADTGISAAVVHQRLLAQAWPQLRGCFPLEGPLPALLQAALVIVPDGHIDELTLDPASDLGEATACVRGVLGELRFAPFGGAHFVRVVYRFRTQHLARGGRAGRGHG